MVGAYTCVHVHEMYNYFFFFIEILISLMNSLKIFLQVTWIMETFLEKWNIFKSTSQKHHNIHVLRTLYYSTYSTVYYMYMYIILQYNTVQCTMYIILQYNTVQCTTCTLYYSTIQYSVLHVHVHYITVQYSTMYYMYMYIILQYNTIQCATCTCTLYIRVQ